MNDMGNNLRKKTDELKVQLNKLSLKVDLLNEYVSEHLGFDEDTEKVKCKCKSVQEDRLLIEPPFKEPPTLEEVVLGLQNNDSTPLNKLKAFAEKIKGNQPKSKVKSLPEGVKFLRTSEGDQSFFTFGNNQVIRYDSSCDYVASLYWPLIQKDITDKCHLEPCNTKDLSSGDWFVLPTHTVQTPYLFINPSKSLKPEFDGTITKCGFLNPDVYVMKIIYTP